MPGREPPDRPVVGSNRAERLRRLRARPALRDLAAETAVSPSMLIQPLFIGPDRRPGPVRGLAALQRRSVASTARETSRLRALGIPAVLLFGIPSRKDPNGSAAWDPIGPVPKAIRAIRAREPEAVVIADVCLCEYTTHGHCGLLLHGRVDNDRTLPMLGRAAVAYADAGADLVAPSAMMDHQVAEIRRALDAAGRTGVGIMAYAAKFASALYGPFRDAASSLPLSGDRKGYQLDPRNAREALRELRADAEEGADVLMVKPALPYLDVLAAARREFDHPLAAFQVSGEYAMIKAAAERGWLEETRAVDEMLTSIRRAGADLVVTYFAAEWAARTTREGA